VIPLYLSSSYFNIFFTVFTLYKLVYQNYFVNVYGEAGFVNNDRTLNEMISFWDADPQDFWLNKDARNAGLSLLPSVPSIRRADSL